MLLFLLAAGLSLIHGLMRILNLAHGSYYVLGAYVALSVVAADREPRPGHAGGGGRGDRPRRGDGARVSPPASPATSCPRRCSPSGSSSSSATSRCGPGAARRSRSPSRRCSSASVRLGPLVFPSYRLFLLVVGTRDRASPSGSSRRRRRSAPWCAPPSTTRRSPGPPASTSRCLNTVVFAVGAALAALGGIMAGPVLGRLSGRGFRDSPARLRGRDHRRPGQPQGGLRGRPSRRLPRQLRQGAVPGAGALHDLRAHGRHPGRPAQPGSSASDEDGARGGGRLLALWLWCRWR